MSQIAETGLKSAAAVSPNGSEQTLAPGSQAPSPEPQRAYVPPSKQSKPAAENMQVLVVGACIGILLLLLAWKGIPKAGRSAITQRTPPASNPNQAGPNSSPTPSVLPLLDSGHAPVQEADGEAVDAEQIRETAKKQAPGKAANLGGIQAFPNEPSPDWQPAPYRPPTALPAQINNALANTEKSEREELDKASLVFVRSKMADSFNQNTPASPTEVNLGSGMPSGARLRAHLEAAVSTVVSTPVVAVVEYNYERNGEIAIPAGAKAIGHLESADRSGFVGVRFESLLMPDGSTVAIEAAATDLDLRPLRGRVEGKNTGKNILVRSLTGVGEVAATVVGRSGFNQTLNEADLLRERVSTNVGEAGDEEIAKLAITERLVVTVPAGTEIYLVLGKPTPSRIAGQTTRTIDSTLKQSSSPNLSVEQLHELLQLQRELNPQAAESNPERN